MRKVFKDRPLSRSWSALGLCIALIGAAANPPRVLAGPPQRAARQQPIVIQIGAFRGPTSAVTLALEIEEKGFRPTVVPGDDYYRVVVGPYSNDAEATAALSKLKSLGYDGYVRRDLVVPGAPETPPAQPPPAQPAPAPAEPTVTPEPAPAPAPAEPPAPTPQTPSPPAAEIPPAEQPEPATAPEPPAFAPPEPPTQQPPREPATGPEITTILPGVAEQPTRPEPPATPSPAEPTTAAEILKESAQPPAEVAAAPRQPGTPAVDRVPSTLKMLVLEGQDAINNIKRRTARDPVVQVTDENDRPVAGAAVTFALPDRGASGVFANGGRSMTVLTDSQGMARATGFAPNAVEGDMMMQVSASYQGQTASTVIAQANVVAGAGVSAATIGIIGAVAAAAAVGAVVALGGGDDGPSNNPATRPSGTATVNPGGVTIGAPSQ